jgi:hypothetical protein
MEYLRLDITSLSEAEGYTEHGPFHLSITLARCNLVRRKRKSMYRLFAFVEVAHRELNP